MAISSDLGHAAGAGDTLDGVEDSPEAFEPVGKPDVEDRDPAGQVEMLVHHPGLPLQVIQIKAVRGRQKCDEGLHRPQRHGLGGRRRRPPAPLEDAYSHQWPCGILPIFATTGTHDLSGAPAEEAEMPRGSRPQSQSEPQRESLNHRRGHSENKCIVCPHLVTAEAQPVGDRGLSRARDTTQAHDATASDYGACVQDLPAAVLQDERQNPAAIHVANAAPCCTRGSRNRHISLPREPEGGNAGNIYRPCLALPVPVDRWATLWIPPDSHGRAGDLVRDGGTPVLGEENQAHSLRQKVSDPVPWAFETARRGPPRGGAG